MESSKIMMFPEYGNNNSNMDPYLAMLLNNNGGFGGNGCWIWILFLWLIWGANGWGGMNGMGGQGFLSNQINNDAGRELLMNAIQGNGAAISNLASMLNTDITAVQNGICSLNSAISSVGSQVGMSGLQIQNAIQSGNASIAAQICQCCCENRLAICEQTNTITTQSERNTRSITDAINAQSVMINDKFCDLEKRELQDKITALTADNALLRSNISNDKQTTLFNEKFNEIQNQLIAIKSAQPNTVPVQWPNITAVNTTPQAGAFFGWNNGWGSNSFWN